MQAVHPLQYTINDFLEIRSAYAPQFSADGVYVVYLSDLSGSAQLYRVPVASGVSTQLTDLQDPISSFACSPVEDRIVYAVSDGGNVRDQVYLLDVRSGQVEPHTQSAAGYAALVGVVM